MDTLKKLVDLISAIVSLVAQILKMTPRPNGTHSLLRSLRRKAAAAYLTEIGSLRHPHYEAGGDYAAEVGANVALLPADEPALILAVCGNKPYTEIALREYYELSLRFAALRPRQEIATCRIFYPATVQVQQALALHRERAKTTPNILPLTIHALPEGDPDAKELATLLQRGCGYIFTLSRCHARAVIHDGSSTEFRFYPIRSKRVASALLDKFLVALRFTEEYRDPQTRPRIDQLEQFIDELRPQLP